MSAAAFGKAIGPIAKKIGGEVAEGLSKTADDWGWKGPKKGEISGGEYLKKKRELTEERDFIMDEYERAQMVSTPLERKQLEDDYLSALENNKKKRLIIANKFEKQQGIDAADPGSRFDAQTKILGRASVSFMSDLAEQFAVLERADIPRRWTGKLREAIVKNDPYTGGLPYARVGNKYVNFEDLSKIMEEMTESQRETFVALMPGWADTFEKLIEVSRSL